jgi:hypothetical protein
MSSADPTVSPSFTETIRPTTYSSDSNIGGFSNKTIIIILCLVIVLLLLNDNIINIFRNILILLYNALMNILKLFGYVSGTAINISADVAGDVIRTGVDITEGTLHSVGNILTGTNTGGQSADLDKTLNTSTVGQNVQIPSPDTTENPIQNPISQTKMSWCLVGEYKGRRGCIDISDQDKCLSGQVYPSQKMCLNPTLSQNV